MLTCEQRYMQQVDMLLRVRMCVCVYVCMCVRLYTYIYVCMCLCMCVYVCNTLTRLSLCHCADISGTVGGLTNHNRSGMYVMHVCAYLHHVCMYVNV
jgi:hypothetical protein